MGTTIDNNASAREAVLARVRRALRKSGDDAGERAAAQAYVTARAQGPRPALPADLVGFFMQRAADMASTVERIAHREQIPGAVARYIDALDLPDAIAEQKSRIGVCWPEFEDLDWEEAGLAVEVRPTIGHDRLGITGTLCAIAETGTIVVTTGASTPTATVLLPDTHIAVVARERIVAGMEDAFALIRAQGPLPRGIHMISGPSRTGDIEQTLVLGAHGPYRLHILVLG
jgi:L-lactate dehydrogenase complex protein LldG